MSTTVPEADEVVSEALATIKVAANRLAIRVGDFPSTEPYRVQRITGRFLRDSLNRLVTDHSKLLAAMQFCVEPDPDCVQCSKCERCQYHSSPCVGGA